MSHPVRSLGKTVQWSATPGKGQQAYDLFCNVILQSVDW